MKTYNIYNIDKDFDYDVIKSIVLKSLEKIAKGEELKKKSNVPYDYGSFDYNHNSIIPASPPIPLLKLKIRNTTKYLNWRISM
jgi:hypothetical protein